MSGVGSEDFIVHSIFNVSLAWAAVVSAAWNIWLFHLDVNIQMHFLCPAHPVSFLPFSLWGQCVWTEQVCPVLHQTRWVTWCNHMVRRCHQALGQMVPVNREDIEVAHYLSLSLLLAYTDCFPHSLDLSLLSLILSHPHMAFYQLVSPSLPIYFSLAPSHIHLFIALSALCQSALLFFLLLLLLSFSLWPCLRVNVHLGSKRSALAAEDYCLCALSTSSGLGFRLSFTLCCISLQSPAKQNNFPH